VRNECDGKSEDFASDFCALVYPEITIDDAVLVIIG
jgi:hypothetical protein